MNGVRDRFNAWISGRIFPRNAPNLPDAMGNGIFACLAA
ncbi:MAG: hypothetical protein V7632_3354 [Bradyrhizobium sp.]|jgi:hypothetical protein